MKRFHVHVGVENLEQSIRFYSGLFGAAPAVRRTDYAKWLVEDPRLNFAISARGGRIGVNHLGLQCDSADELAAVRERFAAADAAAVSDERGAQCCYAISDKHWVTDPQGIAWEGYHTLREVRYFDGDAPASAACSTPGGPESVAAKARCAPPAAQSAAPTACCSPARAETAAAKACCAPAAA
jgi:catechol 2,3-dioxygenase-like lactoylglutathione lyase family enzyme